MSATEHISLPQLQKLSSGATSQAELQDATKHVESCQVCQAKLDSVAADPDLWAMASELYSDPALSSRFDQMSAIRSTDHGFDTGQAPIHGNAKHEAQRLLDPPAHPEMMGRLGAYDIEREIGRGGMGIVFKAFDTELHRPVAIKVLAPTLSETGTARQRFAREARAAAAVLHPNVVAIYGVNSQHETPYLVMPYVAGPSLQRLVDDQGPLEEKEIVRMALQIAAGLSAAHAQGLVHRDIKPANILVESDVSRVLVTDFGLARTIGDVSMTQTGCFAGTPNYMSPEQALGKNVDARSDLFSLGSVLYFMATGQMPFRADTPLCVLNRIANDTPTPIRQISNDVSETMRDIVDTLLAKDATHRFSSASELHEVLEQHLAHLHQPDSVAEPRVRRQATLFTRAVSTLIRHPYRSLIAVSCIIGLAGFASILGQLAPPNARSNIERSRNEQSAEHAKQTALHLEHAVRHGEQAALHAAAAEKENRIAQQDIAADERKTLGLPPVAPLPPNVPAPKLGETDDDAAAFPSLRTLITRFWHSLGS